MNIKPTYQQVIEAVGNTQDGNKLNPKDEYGHFLLNLIANNTVSNIAAVDAGEVDTEDLASDLRYAISEFGKALKAVDQFNNDNAGEEHEEELQIAHDKYLSETMEDNGEQQQQRLTDEL